MGLIVTLLYILTAYLSPPVVFGPLSEFHLELVLAVVALAVSIPSLPSGFLKQPQVWAIGGMLFAVFMSRLFTGWLGSAPLGVWEFLPDVFAYVLIVANCRSKRSLQMVILTLFGASCFVILQGALAVHAHDAHSPYIYSQGIGNEEYILRVRGLSIIGDPNDFSQVLVSLLPCLFLFAIPGRRFRNALILVPCIAALIFGLYLTHSRGALVALVAIIVLALRKKIGTIASLVLGGATFAITTAIGWSGGRQISVEAGSDRMDAWATGLELFKSHPLFGIGFKRFTEYNYITAHNSIVVCAAELGFVGFFFWVLFLVASFRRGLSITRLSEIQTEERVASPVFFGTRAGTNIPTSMLPESVRANANLTLPEIRRIADLLVISLAGFLVAGWFLSRAYVMWLFIFGGMIQALLQMAKEQEVLPKLDTASCLIRWSAYTSIFLLAVVYIILRIR